MNDCVARGRLELEAIGSDRFVEGNFGDGHVQAIFVARTIEAKGAGIFGEGGAGSVKRLPVSEANIGEKSALWPVGLQADKVKIGAIEPDFAEYFGLVAAAKHGENVVARGLIVKFLGEGDLFFANFGPKESIDEMLRTKIFNGLGALAVQGNGSNEKFIFRRDGDFEILAVAGHIEHGFAHDRNLANHADIVRTGSEEEGFDFVILADDAAVGGAGGGLELDGGVEGLQIARERIVAVEKLLGSGFRRGGASGGGNVGGFGDG